MQRYNIANEADVIRTIQRYLLAVTPDADNLGITASGRYDPPTSAAVRSFQEKEGLEVNGLVDRPTWNLLWERYAATRLAAVPPVFLEADVFDLQLGDTGHPVIVLQSQLGEFSRIYPNVQRPAITGQFGLTTADAVRAMQRNYGEYADGVVTVPFWNRMQRDYVSKKQSMQ